MLFNPLDRFFKSIRGAVCLDKEITFRVKGNFNSVVLLLKNDKDGLEKCLLMENRNGFFEITLCDMRDSGIII